MQVGEATRQTAHFSFFRRRLAKVARGADLTTWAMEQLNARGHLGASGPEVRPDAANTQVSVEELLVLLAMPHADLDGRLFKLIVRVLQREALDVDRLARLARLERADTLLAWLLGGLPASEATPVTRALAARLKPRTAGLPGYRYDFDRLVRRPATKERLWRRRPG